MARRRRCGQQRVRLRPPRRKTGELAVVASNFTPIPRANYRIGVPRPGFYREVLNTDASCYGGANIGNLGGVEAEPVPSHGEEQSIVITVPPLATVAFSVG